MRTELGFLLTLVMVMVTVVVVTVGVERSTMTIHLHQPLWPIPKHLFGIFFQEINHAGTGGLWAEMVSNRGFEAGATGSAFGPWGVIGNESDILVSTDLSSPFPHNPVALKVDVLRDTPAHVGIYNPGFWGMNIEEGKQYKICYYIRSSDMITMAVSFATMNGTESLSAVKIMSPVSHLLNWTRIEFLLTAIKSNPNARLQFTTNRRGVIWFDQVSAMPTDTYKGHGFRTDIYQMLAELRPGFLRFPGGTFTGRKKLQNSFHWKKTVGPWQERPGHFDAVSNYWTDDGLGFFEELLLAEDLGAEPVWIVNVGKTRPKSSPPHASDKGVNTSRIQPFVQDMLDGIEFARGEASSTWGSVRAKMGHPRPFHLRYVAIGNEVCDSSSYKENYLPFYTALKQWYPDIYTISNCYDSQASLNHPFDMFDFHKYTSPADMFALQHYFDSMSDGDPEIFVSEYAVFKDAGLGNLHAALAEAAFLIGIEKNSDIVAMACYASLLVNTNDRKRNPAAIVFNSSAVYGTPSYWMQQRFFITSNEASLVSSTIQTDDHYPLAASVISRKGGVDNKESYVTVKVVNFGNTSIDFTMTFTGSKKLRSLSKTILSSTSITDENNFENPRKVYPITSPFKGQGTSYDVSLPAYSLQLFDFSGATKRGFKQWWTHQCLISEAPILILAYYFFLFL